ncbi:uncharacterized protein AB675_2917 [Cyphellophora attinorum]|uniref:DUF3824 domain-containing protein n=1 Tax=Cyphellophora attinorum TaxID=1664694 RepID=A0A0N1GZC4_9EURO|nr:uncharacterized protein AB675_2917 [Phialophora attinorum]KPI36464.1 hypothetical protein AB675_2917 [Phialophora attinorum]
MASYDDDRRSSRYKSDRRSRDSYDDMAYDTRDSKSTTMVRRRDDSVSSVEEVTRDFPPGERGAIYRETTVRKSGHRPVGSRSKSYENDYDYYDDRSSYSRRSRRGHRDDDTYVSRRSRKYDDRDGRRGYDSYSDYSSRSRSPPRKKDKERRKSTTEQLLTTVGLGGVAGALLGKKDKSRSRSRSRDRRSDRSRHRGRSSSSSRSRSKERGGKKSGKERGAEALKAALLAGVVEAVRARKEPGGWGGDKGKRVLTAAVSAGGVDGILSHNRDKDHSTRDVIGAAVAGLATNRIVNGARSKSRGPADDRGRRDGSADRGRSPSRGGIGDIAAGGTIAATGKKIWDRVRSRSRGRAKSRDSSYDSYDSRDAGRPKPERKRSSSVSAAVAKGLGAIGLGSAADKVDPSRRQQQSRNFDEHYDDRDRGRGYYDDASNNGYNGYRDPRDRDPRDVGALTPANGPGAVGPRAVSTSRVPSGQYRADTAPRHTGDPETDSDSDLGSSSGEEAQVKKSRKKTYITGALATVATIHAGHSIYTSVEKRNARRKALKEGDISPEEARREKNRARLQDAASVGIAALGIKGAYSEWNSMREENKEALEKKEAAERHKHKRDARRKKEQLMAAQAYREGGFHGDLPHLGPSDSPYYGSDAGHYAPSQPQSAGPVHYTDGNPFSSYSNIPAQPQPQAQHPSQQQPPNPQVYATPPPGASHYDHQPYPPQAAGYQHPYDIPPPPMGPPRADTH